MRTPKSFLKNASSFIGLCLTVALLPLIAGCGSSEEGFPLFPYLADRGVDAVRIEFDLASVYEKDSADFPALLHWQEAGGSAMTVPVSIRIRGKNRREVCDFPPLKMDLQGGQGHPFAEGCYKLVTHCLAGGGESLLFREYIAYQLYEDLTPFSFRSRLLRVTYADREGRLEPVESWVVLLESKDDLLERLEATDIDAKEEPLKEISGTDYHRFAVFQYMVGNTDWNLDLEHNVKWILPRELGLPVPVPYDFDRSGLVNASYAEPHYKLPIRTVRERYFQWRGHDRQQLAPLLDEFRARKDELLGEVWEMESLSILERQDLAAYLEEFFLHMDELLTEGVRRPGQNNKAVTQAG